MGNKIGKEIIKKYLERSGQVKDEELENIYKTYDASGDGLLQRNEVQVLTKHIIQIFIDQVSEDIEKGKFTYFTKETLLKNKKKWLSNEYQNKIISDMDKNGDNEISFEEFKEWFTNFLDYGAPDNETRNTLTLKKSRDEDDNKTVNGYIVVSLIGKGSFGKVYLAMHQNTNKAYALKKMNKVKLKGVKIDVTRTALEQLYEEINVLKILKHPNIVKLYETIDDQNVDKIYLVLEYCEKGEAYDMNSGKPLDEKTAKLFFMNLILGIEYCHKNFVIHRDIKPENLLLDAKGLLKISDFGSAKILLNESETLKVSAGTPAFASPESCIPDTPYSGYTSDVWACGITLYCFLYGELPFKGENITTIYDSILNNEPIYSDKVSKEANQVLSLILEKDPKKRLTIDEIKKLKWFEESKDEWDKYINDKNVKYYHIEGSTQYNDIKQQDDKTSTTTSNNTSKKSQSFDKKKHNSMEKKSSSLFGLFKFKSLGEEELGPPQERRKRSPNQSFRSNSENDNLDELK